MLSCLKESRNVIFRRKSVSPAASPSTGERNGRRFGIGLNTAPSVAGVSHGGGKSWRG